MIFSVLAIATAAIVILEHVAFIDEFVEEKEKYDDLLFFVLCVKKFNLYLRLIIR